MDSDQNDLASESSLNNSLTESDWNLIFGSKQEEDVCRGAQLREASLPPRDDELLFTPINTKNVEQSQGLRDPFPIRLEEVDTLFLTRYAILATNVTFPLVYQFVLDFIAGNKQTCGNFVYDKANALIRGALFDETRFAEYQIKWFSSGGRMGFYLDILEGFAPCVQGFWKDLQQVLEENNLIKSETSSDDESDSESIFDSDLDDSDDECEPFDLESAKFLKLSESPELVQQWFQDLSNPNFMEQTLLLMAWNCQNEQNFLTITGEKQAQHLFDTIIACMITTAADFCLPIARCASLLVSQLVDSHDIKISQEQFNVLVQTLVQWTLSNQQGEQTEVKLNSSKEVASILSSQMSKMAPLAVNWKDTLTRVYDQAPYDCVRRNLHNLVRAY